MYIYRYTVQKLSRESDMWLSITMFLMLDQLVSQRWPQQDEKPMFPHLSCILISNPFTKLLSFLFEEIYSGAKKKITFGHSLCKEASLHKWWFIKLHVIKIIIESINTIHQWNNVCCKCSYIVHKVNYTLWI